MNDMVAITNAQEIYAHDNGAINVFIEYMSTTTQTVRTVSSNNYAFY